VQGVNAVRASASRARAISITAHPIRNRRSVAARAEAPAAPGIETTGPNFTASKDIQEIMDILPHR
jgi:hypothetical protein